MMRQRLMRLALAVVLLLGSGGCWNRLEPENYAWLAWLGLDTAPGGQVRIMIVLTPPLSPVPTGAAPPENLINVSSATGETLFDAVREINAHVPKRLFWSYLHAVIISEDLARAGVAQHLEALLRNARVRKNAWVFVTKGPLDNIFKIDPQIEKNPVFLLDSLVKAEEKFLGKSRVLRLRDFDAQVAEPGVDPVVSVLGVWDPAQKKLVEPGGPVPAKSEPAMDGSAVFRGDKLAGWLSPDESQDFLLAKGEMKTGLIVVPHPDNPADRAGIEIIGSKAKLTASVRDGQVTAKVAIKIQGNLGDQWLPEPVPAGEDPGEDPQFYRALEDNLTAKVKGDVEELLARSQTELDADMLGVGDYLANRYPIDWEKLAGDWPDFYRKAMIEVEVKVKITSSNIMRSHPPRDTGE